MFLDEITLCDVLLSALQNVLSTDNSVRIAGEEVLAQFANQSDFFSKMIMCTVDSRNEVTLGIRLMALSTVKQKLSSSTDPLIVRDTIHSLMQIVSHDFPMSDTFARQLASTVTAALGQLRRCCSSLVDVHQGRRPDETVDKTGTHFAVGTNRQQTEQPQPAECYDGTMKDLVADVAAALSTSSSTSPYRQLYATFVLDELMKLAAQDEHLLSELILVSDQFLCRVLYDDMATTAIDGHEKTFSTYCAVSCNAHGRGDDVVDMPTADLERICSNVRIRTMVADVVRQTYMLAFTSSFERNDNRMARLRCVWQQHTPCLRQVITTSLTHLLTNNVHAANPLMRVCILKLCLARSAMVVDIVTAQERWLRDFAYTDTLSATLLSLEYDVSLYEKGVLEYVTEDKNDRSVEVKDVYLMSEHCRLRWSFVQAVLCGSSAKVRARYQNVLCNWCSEAVAAVTITSATANASLASSDSNTNLSHSQGHDAVSLSLHRFICMVLCYASLPNATVEMWLDNLDALAHTEDEYVQGIEDGSARMASTMHLCACVRLLHDCGVSEGLLRVLVDKFTTDTNLRSIITRTPAAEADVVANMGLASKGVHHGISCNGADVNEETRWAASMMSWRAREALLFVLQCVMRGGGLAVTHILVAWSHMNATQSNHVPMLEKLLNAVLLHDVSSSSPINIHGNNNSRSTIDQHSRTSSTRTGSNAWYMVTVRALSLISSLLHRARTGTAEVTLMHVTPVYMTLVPRALAILSKYSVKANALGAELQSSSHSVNRQGEGDMVIAEGNSSGLVCTVTLRLLRDIITHADDAVAIQYFATAQEALLSVLLRTSSSRINDNNTGRNSDAVDHADVELLYIVLELLTLWLRRVLRCQPGYPTHPRSSTVIQMCSASSFWQTYAHVEFATVVLHVWRIHVANPDVAELMVPLLRLLVTVPCYDDVWRAQLLPWTACVLRGEADSADMCVAPFLLRVLKRVFQRGSEPMAWDAINGLLDVLCDTSLTTEESAIRSATLSCAAAALRRCPSEAFLHVADSHGVSRGSRLLEAMVRLLCLGMNPCRSDGTQMQGGIYVSPPSIATHAASLYQESASLARVGSMLLALVERACDYRTDEVAMFIRALLARLAVVRIDTVAEQLLLPFAALLQNYRDDLVDVLLGQADGGDMFTEVLLLWLPRIHRFATQRHILRAMRALLGLLQHWPADRLAAVEHAHAACGHHLTLENGISVPALVITVPKVECGSERDVTRLDSSSLTEQSASAATTHRLSSPRHKEKQYNEEFALQRASCATSPLHGSVALTHFPNSMLTLDQAIYVALSFALLRFASYSESGGVKLKTVIADEKEVSDDEDEAEESSCDDEDGVEEWMSDMDDGYAYMDSDDAEDDSVVTVVSECSNALSWKQASHHNSKATAGSGSEGHTKEDAKLEKTLTLLAPVMYDMKALLHAYSDIVLSNMSAKQVDILTHLFQMFDTV